MALDVLAERRANRPGLDDDCGAMICEINNNRIHPFVGCFSFNPESPRQWRERAENATGFAIAFNRVKLEESLAFGLADSAGWGKVEYDSSEQESRIKKAIDKYFSDVGRRVNCLDHPWILRGVTVEEHFRALWKVAALIKRPCFEWEEEWRLIAMPREDLRAPDPTAPLTMGQYAIENGERDGREIPFFTFPFSADCITEVHVGRKCRYWGNDALKDLLESNGVHAKVIHSPITFR
jgi:hypothetical protein